MISVKKKGAVQKGQDHGNVFKDTRAEQLKRDQEEWPIDQLPLEDERLEAKEEKEKHKTKNQSQSEKKYNP
ncbi:hypothetical protein [Rossellomorea sp. BNER]|uniref:hypothetical protein n=1 Tax=Rossellomorea sp. BNER TaxID=2962031 RepID=UPI003AF201AA|nr:hypothetical protein [Rossellomorea sp. BNER]